jgi:hypothetical protein
MAFNFKATSRLGQTRPSAAEILECDHGRAHDRMAIRRRKSSTSSRAPRRGSPDDLVATRNHLF